MKELNFDQFQCLSRQIENMFGLISVNQEREFTDDFFSGIALTYISFLFKKDVDLSVKQFNHFVEYVVERFSWYKDHINKDFPGEGKHYAADFLKRLGYNIIDPMKFGDDPIKRYSNKKRFYVVNQYDERV